MALTNLKNGGYKFINLIKTIGVNFIALILAVLIFVLIPIIVPGVFGPLCTIRYIIKKSAKWLRPDLSKIVTLNGTILAADTLASRPKVNIVVALIIEGTLELDELKGVVTRNLLKGQFSNGEMKFPELKQYLTSWLGYFFWTEDKTFDLDRHVNLCGVNGLSSHSDAEIQDIYQALIQKPWAKKRPRWEMSLVHNYYLKGGDTPHTVVYFRVHHSLGDGYSIFKLIWEGIAEKKFAPLNATPKYVERNYCQSIFFWTTFPFLGCFDLAMYAIESVPQMSLKNMFKKSQPEKTLVSVADKIPIAKIKEIKNHFRVSVASVICAVCAGTIRDIMISKNMKVPGVIRSGTVLPIPGHSEKLRNQFAVGLLRICTGEADPLKRLEFCQKDYLRLKSSAGTLLSTYLSQLGGFIPLWILGPIFNLRSMAMTSGITSFPAGFEHLSMDGHKCVDTMFAAGLGILGISFNTLSYVDGLRIIFVAKDSVMTREEVNEVTQILQKHVDILHEKTVQAVSGFDNSAFTIV